MNASPILAFSYSCMLHIERPISGLMITNISKTSVVLNRSQHDQTKKPRLTDVQACSLKKEANIMTNQNCSAITMLCQRDINKEIEYS